MIFQFAVSKAVEAYQLHYTKADKVSEEVLLMIKDAIAKFAYIDDPSLLHAGRDIIKFMT